MTGSLQIKGGKYYMVINYIDPTGKRKNKWIGTKLSAKGNKKAARAMLDRWLQEHKDGSTESFHLLFTDYMEQWMSMAQGRLKPTTIRGYNGCLKNHILPYFRSRQTRLLELSVDDLDCFYSFLQSEEKGLSAESVRRCHGVISKALNDAFRKRKIPSNPAALADCPKPGKFVGAFLNMRQLEQVVALFEGNILHSVVKFIATYGVRRGEALGLCWDKVDFENNQFTICRSLIQAVKGNILQDPKTPYSYRTLPLTIEMREMLLELKEAQRANRELFQDAYANEHNLVFVWPSGSVITPNYLTAKFHQILKKSSLPVVRVHDLRHSVASNLLAMGFSPVEVQLWMGHARPSTTLDTYSHVNAHYKLSVCGQINENLCFKKAKDKSATSEEF